MTGTLGRLPPVNQGQAQKGWAEPSPSTQHWGLREQERGEAVGALASTPEKLPASLPWEKEVLAQWQRVETVSVSCATE